MASPTLLIDEIKELQKYANTELNWFKRLFVSIALLNALDNFNATQADPEQAKAVWEAFKLKSTGFLNWLGKKFLSGLNAFEVFANSVAAKKENQASESLTLVTNPVVTHVERFLSEIGRAHV